MSSRTKLGALGVLAALGALTGWAILSRQGDEGFLIKWKPTLFPLRCLVVGGAVPGGSVRAQAAINQRVGRPLISPCTRWSSAEPLRGAVLIYVGTIAPRVPELLSVQTPWTVHPGGRTYLYREARENVLHSASIVVEPRWAENSSVWLHELGHALGLAHDRLRSSIMWPTIQERPGALSSSDVERLRKAYTR